MYCLIGPNLIKQRNCSYRKINRATAYSKCCKNKSEQHTNTVLGSCYIMFSLIILMKLMRWPESFVRKSLHTSCTHLIGKGLSFLMTHKSWRCGTYEPAIWWQSTPELSLRRVALFREALKQVSWRKLCYMKSLPLHQNTCLSKKYFALVTEEQGAKNINIFNYPEKKKI